MTSACCSPCRSGSGSTNPHPLRLGWHSRLGDFNLRRNPPLRFTFAVAVAGHLLRWLETSRIATVPLRCPLAWAASAVYAPSRIQPYRSPACDRPMEEIHPRPRAGAFWFCRLQPLASVCLASGLQVPPPFLALTHCTCLFSDTTRLFNLMPPTSPPGDHNVSASNAWQVALPQR